MKNNLVTINAILNRGNVKKEDLLKLFPEAQMVIQPRPSRNIIFFINSKVDVDDIMEIYRAVINWGVSKSLEILEDMGDIKIMRYKNVTYKVNITTIRDKKNTKEYEYLNLFSPYMDGIDETERENFKQLHEKIRDYINENVKEEEIDDDDYYYNDDEENYDEKEEELEDDDDDDDYYNDVDDEDLNDDDDDDDYHNDDDDDYYYDEDEEECDYMGDGVNDLERRIYNNTLDKIEECFRDIIELTNVVKVLNNPSSVVDCLEEKKVELEFLLKSIGYNDLVFGKDLY